LSIVVVKSAGFIEPLAEGVVGAAEADGATEATAVADGAAVAAGAAVDGEGNGVAQAATRNTIGTSDIRRLMSALLLGSWPLSDPNADSHQPEQIQIDPTKANHRRAGLPREADIRKGAPIWRPSCRSPTRYERGLA
jgi:hypothetical protein